MGNVTLEYNEMQHRAKPESQKTAAEGVTQLENGREERLTGQG